MKEIFYSGGEGKERLVITEDCIETEKLVIPNSTITSVEVTSSIVGNFVFAALMATFGINWINKDYNLLGYSVLVVALLVAIMTLTRFPAKVIVRASGQKHQITEGSLSEMNAVKDAVARALAARK